MDTGETRTLKNDFKALPGFKNLMTDRVGLERYDLLKAECLAGKYPSREAALKEFRTRGFLLISQFKAEGRLWRKNDKTRVL